MDISVYNEMYRVEEIHWWFVAKRRIVLHILERFAKKQKLETNDLTVCDIGCGCGATLKSLSKIYKSYGVDVSDTAIKYCRERGLTAVKGDLNGDMPYEGRKFDIILMLDVLEHIDNDTMAVEKAASLLKPNGLLICTVPAYNWLWSHHDEIHHHRRRYTKKSLLKMFEVYCETTPILCTYYNSILFPLALIERIFFKPFFHKPNRMINPIPNRILNRILANIFSFEKHLILKINFPFGLSIIGVFQKNS